jgi:hypothetical protein
MSAEKPYLHVLRYKPLPDGKVFVRADDYDKLEEDYSYLYGERERLVRKVQALELAVDRLRTRLGDVPGDSLYPAPEKEAETGEMVRRFFQGIGRTGA